jgi:hypothetical protein
VASRPRRQTLAIGRRPDWAMGRLRLPLAVLRQVYAKTGGIAWLLAVCVSVILMICIALWAKTAPSPPEPRLWRARFGLMIRFGRPPRASSVHDDSGSSGVGHLVLIWISRRSEV